MSEYMPEKMSEYVYAIYTSRWCVRKSLEDKPGWWWNSCRNSGVNSLVLGRFDTASTCFQGTTSQRGAGSSCHPCWRGWFHRLMALPAEDFVWTINKSSMIIFAKINYQTMIDLILILIWFDLIWFDLIGWLIDKGRPSSHWRCNQQYSGDQDWTQDKDWTHGSSWAILRLRVLTALKSRINWKVCRRFKRQPVHLLRSCWICCDLGRSSFWWWQLSSPRPKRCPAGSSNWVCFCCNPCRWVSCHLGWSDTGGDRSQFQEMNWRKATCSLSGLVSMFLLFIVDHPMDLSAEKRIRQRPAMAICNTRKIEILKESGILPRRRSQLTPFWGEETNQSHVLNPFKSDVFWHKENRVCWPWGHQRSLDVSHLLTPWIGWHNQTIFPILNGHIWWWQITIRWPFAKWSWVMFYGWSSHIGTA